MPHRIERVNHLIRQEICELLQRQVKDPRLSSFITVTEVTTTPDLRYAKVYVSSFSNDVKKEEILSILKAAAGFFRSELAKQLRLKHIPELSFQWDDSIERGARIQELIDRVSAAKTGDEPRV